MRVPPVGAGNAHSSEHLSSYPILTGVRISRSSVFCVLFWRLLFVLSLVRSSDYPLWYHQLFLLFVNMFSIMNIGEILITWRQHGRKNGQISNKMFN
jgi:hypothetical protein